MTDSESPETGDLVVWKVGEELTAWPGLKVARARAHARELVNLLEGWLAARPFEVELVLGADSLSLDGVLRLRTDPPLGMWALAVGDAFHCLRVALDAITWEFATLDGAEPRWPKRVQFPILTDAGGWKDFREKWLATVPPVALERIRQMQPFVMMPGPAQRSALELVASMDNLDKHTSAIQIEPRVKSVLGRWRFALEGDPPTASDAFAAEMNDDARLADGQRLYTVRSAHPIREVHDPLGEVNIGIELQTPAGPMDFTEAFDVAVNGVSDCLGYLRTGGATRVQL